VYIHVQDTVMAIDVARPAGMGVEDYSRHAARLLQILQIAYEVQLADMEELELRVESTHSLEQVFLHAFHFIHPLNSIAGHMTKQLQLR
jgi:hypothetical protein